MSDETRRDDPMPDQDALRVELGEVLADAAGEDPNIIALFAIMTAANPAESDGEILARYVLGRLAAQGWRISKGDYENAHRIALARELTYQAGVPLRDRYGFAATEEDVLAVVDACFTHAEDKAAADAIGLAVMVGDLELASEYDTATDEAYELAIVAALRPLVANRRAAAERGLR